MLDLFNILKIDILIVCEDIGWVKMLDLFI